MFCYQCEQTAHNTGCTQVGICGKNPETAALQDLLVYAAKGISMYAHRAIELGKQDRDIDVFVMKALFATVTNVNFDPERLKTLLLQAGEVKNRAKALYESACQSAGKQPETLAGPAAWTPVDNLSTLIEQGQAVSITKRLDSLGDDLTGLQELLTYGVKGAAAYADHAHILGRDDDTVYAHFHKALNALTDPNPTVEGLFELNMECGSNSVRVLEMLDSANTGAYGQPVPTKVLMGHVRGKAIVVSGHDLKDLEELLKQTEGKGINIYTHGEMLPAHGYPQLKKYKHLVGHFGGAWMRQGSDFDRFPGAILMTTNCLQEPRSTYKHRIFTCGLVAWPDVTHISNRDFSPVIEAALAEEGFTGDSPEKFHTLGFGHNTVLGIADKVIDGIKAGAIKHFFVVGGCDGAEVGRNYYTDFAENTPEDSFVLTLGCGKFRLLNSDLGELAGLPRLLDMGQCNDSYSAVKVALALAEAFDTDVNNLPVSIVLSWYEQKAVTVLLALLSLGVKDIRVGPRLPAFISNNVLKVLQEKFNIMPVGDAVEDVKACMA